MANLTFENAHLKLVFQSGIDEYGDPIVSSKTYRNLRSNVTAEKLAAVVQALMTLSKDPVLYASTSRTEKIEL
ncbi:MAG: DUF1659 domain-containing protein [Lysinibacillus sp.]|nr:DUF1659 domain-containing protein [Lysinibacillus sp.]